MSDHHLSSFDLASFNPVGSTRARSRRAPVAERHTPGPAAQNENAQTELPEPTMTPGEAADLRAELAALREAATAAQVEAAAAREAVEAIQRVEAEKRRLEALRATHRISILGNGLPGWVDPDRLG